MSSSMRRVAQLAVVGLVASLAVVFAQPAAARMAPETLADRQPAQAGPVEPGFPVDYVGVLWDTAHGHDHADDAGHAAPHGAVRFRHDGQWGAWVPLIEDGVEADHLWASGLVSGGDAEAYQVRGIPGHAHDPRVVAINTTDGPLVQVGEARGGTAAALDSSMCQSRADWGANEGLRFDSDGHEIWPAEHHPLQALTVHHTATTNDDPDPEATVRAIYRYHAVDQGWGDIGYQYLVDESGVVYEGRWSGAQSTSCETGGGDGSDFGHNTSDQMVTAAHVGGSNSGNMGVALLGELTDHPRWGGDPKAAAVDSLEDVLAELGVRHHLDPTGTVSYVNPVTGDQKTVDTISGHRDWSATECPGERLYDQLPTIRQRVADKMAGLDGGGGGTGSDSMHVSDLDGTGQANRNQWRATVTITVVDGDGSPVADATVDGRWTTTGTGASCTTGGTGTCAVTSPWVHKQTESLTFTVDGISHGSLTYDSTANGDPDGDSDGTTITVAK